MGVLKAKFFHLFLLLVGVIYVNAQDQIQKTLNDDDQKVIVLLKKQAGDDYQKTQIIRIGSKDKIKFKSDQLAIDRDNKITLRGNVALYLEDATMRSDQITIYSTDKPSEPGALEKLIDDANKQIKLVVVDENEFIEVEDLGPDVFYYEDDPVDDDSGDTVQTQVKLPDNNLELRNCTAFPNPTKGYINLRFDADNAPTLIRVVDMNGREIYREKLDRFDGTYENRIDVTQAATGMIFLTISQGKEVYIEKIINQGL